MESRIFRRHCCQCDGSVIILVGIQFPSKDGVAGFPRGITLVKFLEGDCLGSELCIALIIWVKHGVDAVQKARTHAPKPCLLVTLSQFNEVINIDVDLGK